MRHTDGAYPILKQLSKATQNGDTLEAESVTGRPVLAFHDVGSQDECYTIHFPAFGIYPPKSECFDYASECANRMACYSSKWHVASNEEPVK